MEPTVAHRRAQQVFASVLASVRAEHLDASTPCEGWTVRDVLDHVVGGNDRMAGLPGEGDPARAGDLAGAFPASAERASAVFEAPGGLERTFELRIGPVPGSVCVRMRTTDVLVHAWDVARATGQPSDLDPELAGEVLPFVQGFLRPELRGAGRPFGLEQPCPPDAAAADRLAALAGRHPGWSPPR